MRRYFPKFPAVAAFLLVATLLGHGALLPTQPPVYPVWGQIPMRGVSGDHEGAVAWHTYAAGGPEAIHTGHPVPWDPCGGQFAYYYLASRDYDGIDPQSDGAIHGLAPIAGLPRFTAALAANGFNLGQLKAKYTTMSLGDDIQGQDWDYDANTRTETRRYRGGTFVYLLNGHPLIGGAMPDFYMVLKYAAGGAACFDNISGFTEPVRPVDQSQGSPAAVQAVAAALMQDMGAAGELRFVYDSFQPALQWEYQGARRGGAFFDAQVGRLEVVFRGALAIDDVQIAEGNDGGSIARFTVSLSQAFPLDVTVDYATANGTAEAGVDYTAANGTLTIPAGQLSGAIEVTISGDGAEEPDETFFVNLANPVNASISDGQGRGTIQNDDLGLPRLSINDVDAEEGDAGVALVRFTVSLSRVNGQDVTVHYATSDGMALAGEDYNETHGDLRIPAGQLSATLEVWIRGDASFEPDETFFVTLNNPVGANLLDDRGTGTLRNDDPLLAMVQPPVMPVGGQIPARGVSGDHEGTIAWYTTAGGPEPVVNAHQTPWNMCGGERAYYYIASRDFDGIDPLSSGGIHGLNPVAGFPRFTAALAANGFNIGQFKAKYTRMSLGNDLRGQDWDYDANTSTEIRRYQGGTFTFLLDNQPLAGGDMPDFYMVIKYAIGGIPCNDRISGYTAPVRPVDQSQGSPAAVQAVAAALLEDLGAGQIRFVYDSFQPATDWDYSGGGRSGAFFDAQVGRLELVYDATLAINDIQVFEGQNGMTFADFTVTLSQVCEQNVQVDYATADGTALAGEDYNTEQSTLTIPAGQRTGTISLVVWGDGTEEPDETFFVTLSHSVNAGIADERGQCTIRNDEPLSLIINNATVLEGNAGLVEAEFTVSLSRIFDQDVSVTFSTENGTAQAGSDYDAVADTLTIPAGQPSGIIRVPVRGDLEVEQDETFFVNLLECANAIILDGQGRGIIQNDDQDPPTLSIDDVALLEGNEGLTQARFTVTLSRVSDQPVRAKYAVSDGTARLGEDFSDSHGDLLIPEGELSTTLDVWIRGDTAFEPDETFFVTLSDPVNATLLRGLAMGTIRNDDELALAEISISDASQAEGNAGFSYLVFNVTLARPSAEHVEVSYATSNLTAQAGNDFGNCLGNLLFLPGETSLTIEVPILGDLLPESDETFYVYLLNPVKAVLARERGMGAILNDDEAQPLSELSVNDVQVAEGDAGFIEATFTVTLWPPSALEVQVGFSTADGTALIGVDLGNSGGTLRFLPGKTNSTFSVNVKGDTIIESDETFFVNLANPVNATITRGQGTGTILDDDQPEEPPVLAIVKTPDQALVLPETEVWFTIRVENLGGTAALYVGVQDFLPDGMEYRNVSTPAGISFNDTHLEWTIPQLNPAEAVELRLSAQVATLANLTQILGLEHPPGANDLLALTNLVTAWCVDGEEVIRATSTATVRILPSLAISGMKITEDGAFEFSVPAELDRLLNVQASEDLVNWTVIGSFNPHASEGRFADLEARTRPMRFYRLALP